jgi:hypothetical protein
MGRKVGPRPISWLQQPSQETDIVPGDRFVVSVVGVSLDPGARGIMIADVDGEIGDRLERQEYGHPTA